MQYYVIIQTINKWEGRQPQGKEGVSASAATAKTFIAHSTAIVKKAKAKAEADAEAEVPGNVKKCENDWGALFSN